MSEQVQGADGGRAEGPRPDGPPAGRRSHSGQAATGGQQAELQPGCQVRAPGFSSPTPSCPWAGTQSWGHFAEGTQRVGSEEVQDGVFAVPIS